MESRQCCLSLCAVEQTDSEYKKCALCHCPLPHVPKFEKDPQLLAHYSEHHPQVELIQVVQSFKHIAPGIVPTIETFYYVQSQRTCDHEY